MSQVVVHTIGSTAYFVLALLFLWASRIPRTNPGAGWWSAAMLCAFLARMSIVLTISPTGDQAEVAPYTVFIALEKVLLVLGLMKFSGVLLNRSVFTAAIVLIPLMVGTIIWFGKDAGIAGSLGLATFNACFLTCATWIALKHRETLRPLIITSLASGLLIFHWLPGYVIAMRSPDAYPHGFLIGTILVMAQYMSLLAALFLNFQNRLLAAESRALDMAFEDPLTGLNNKRYLTTLFDKVLALATRSQQLIAIIYIDLDNFKPINDTDGHSTGDEVLKEVARRLRTTTRTADICVRAGGDEFVAICTQLSSADQANEIARKILNELTRPISVNGRMHELGASIGISLYPLHGNSLATLLEYADSAMYEVKRAGKNFYKLHTVNSV